MLIFNKRNTNGQGVAISGALIFSKNLEQMFGNVLIKGKSRSIKKNTSSIVFFGVPFLMDMTNKFRLAWEKSVPAHTRSDPYV